MLSHILYAIISMEHVQYQMRLLSVPKLKCIYFCPFDFLFNSFTVEFIFHDSYEIYYQDDKVI
jgi:hypothetical protein